MMFILINHINFFIQFFHKVLIRDQAQLLDYALARSGPKPVLVEWDTDVPDWSILRARRHSGS